MAHTGTAALAIANAAKPVAPVAAEPRSADDMLAGKTVPGLKRDYAILCAMRDAGNKAVPLKVIYARVRQVEPDLTENALTSYLLRLEDQKLLIRPRRGRYDTTEQAIAYFAKLPTALDKEGENLPKM
jgi:hypothetical protein